MPRKRLVLQHFYPYALTGRSNNKDWFNIPMSRCWRIFEDQIEKTAERYGITTHSFVLMSNHFHWLVTTPEDNLDMAMRYFMTETSRRIARASGRINKIYGSRYKWSVIGDAGYYANTVRYLYQNPLRAGICKTVDQYPWSTRSRRSKIIWHSCAGLDSYVPTDRKVEREWLNTIPDQIYNEAMKKALRRAEFKFPRHPTLGTALSPKAFLALGE